jgi:hypothetical protein
MAELSQHARCNARLSDVNSAVAVYDLPELLFGRQLGHRLDFLRPQFGHSLRCHFGR